MITNNRIYPIERIKPGDVTWAWCHVHGVRTDKLYTGYSYVCLECHPERDPRKEESDV